MCVSVGIHALVSACVLTETDMQMSFLINQMLLIYNQIFLLLLIWQFSQTTVLTCFCFALFYLHGNFFSTKQSYFSSKESS